MQRGPGKSTWKASHELGIAQRSIQRILYSDLRVFPYKISVLHELSKNDKERWLQFAAWAEEQHSTIHGFIM
jgi:hypothetical protein